MTGISHERRERNTRLSSGFLEGFKFGIVQPDGERGVLSV